jgi:hypothetical protein
MLRQDPSKLSIATEALELAQELHSSKLEPLLEGTDIIKLRPTISDDLVDIYPQSFEFTSVHRFEVVIRYLMTRIILTGLIQSLCKMSDITMIFNLSEIQDEEIKTANLIAMSNQYACSLGSVGMLHILLPMQISFGAWHRLQKRERARGDDMEEYLLDLATYMKAWSLRTMNKHSKVWGGSNHGAELEIKTEAFEGGPLWSWMARKPRDS